MVIASIITDGKSARAPSWLPSILCEVALTNPPLTTQIRNDALIAPIIRDKQVFEKTYQAKNPLVEAQLTEAQLTEAQLTEAQLTEAEQLFEEAFPFKNRTDLVKHLSKVLIPFGVKRRDAKKLQADAFYGAVTMKTDKAHARFAVINKANNVCFNILSLFNQQLDLMDPQNYQEEKVGLPYATGIAIRQGLLSTVFEELKKLTAGEVSLLGSIVLPKRYQSTFSALLNKLEDNGFNLTTGSLTELSTSNTPRGRVYNRTWFKKACADVVHSNASPLKRMPLYQTRSKKKSRVQKHNGEAWRNALDDLVTLLGENLYAATKDPKKWVVVTTSPQFKKVAQLAQKASRFRRDWLKARRTNAAINLLNSAIKSAINTNSAALRFKVDIPNKDYLVPFAQNKIISNMTDTITSDLSSMGLPLRQFLKATLNQGKSIKPVPLDIIQKKSDLFMQIQNPANLPANNIENLLSKGANACAKYALENRNCFDRNGFIPSHFCTITIPKRQITPTDYHDRNAAVEYDTLDSNDPITVPYMAAYANLVSKALKDVLTKAKVSSVSNARIDSEQKRDALIAIMCEALNSSSTSEATEKLKEFFDGAVKQ